MTFHTDAEALGLSQYVEGEVTLGEEYLLPAGTISRCRWAFPPDPQNSGVVPVLKIYKSDNSILATIPFDTTVADAWNWATPGAGIVIPGGTYRVAVNTTKYKAFLNFYAGGPVTRSPITGNRGCFTGGQAAPATTSNHAYLLDLDFTPASASPTVKYWDGSTEITVASVKVWDGSVEQSIDSISVV